MLCPARLRSCRTLWVLAVVACWCAAISSASAAQTKAWRVGVGGDLPTGFLGALSIYGLPHETILDREMASAKELAKFQIVILSRPSYGVAEVTAAVEEYVRNGGCAIYEYPCVPSETMIAGRRIPPQKGPSMLYESGSPVTGGLTDAVLNTARAGGDMASIIPTDPKVKVLTRFTDKGAKKELQGKFIDNNRGAPAIIMTDYGKGKVVWSGIRLSIAAAFDDNRYIAPFIANLMRELSGGELTPRFAAAADASDTLLTDPQVVRCNLPRFTPGDEAVIPDGAEVLDDAADSVEEFNLYGKILPGSDAIVYLAYHNDDSYRAVRFEQHSVSIVRMDEGVPTVLRSVPRPDTKGWLNVMVRRRWGRVAVHADGSPLISACDGAPLSGVVAAEGMLDAGYQPVVPVDFTDGFTRTAEETDPWEAVSGTWQMVKTEGEPSEAANPFRYQGITTGADATAIARTGAWFWDDYSVEVAVFADSAACGVIAHYQDPARYVLMRLATPAQGKATVAIVERTPQGESVLASAPVQCERRRWYKLALRATSGLIEGVLDGEVILSASDRHLNSGGIGMCVQDGKAQFDDVEVTPWHGTRRPLSGWGPWEWVLKGGEWEYDPAAGDGGAVKAVADEGGTALSPYDTYGNGRFEADVNPAPGSAAGLIMRYQDSQSYVAARLVRDLTGSLTAQIVRRRADRDELLASAPVDGGARDWHHLSADAVDHSLAVLVDGKPCIRSRTAAPACGAVGLHVTGTSAFRNWSFLPLQDGEGVNDTPTPAYAGIIDRNSWAGRAGAWQADPNALDAFWHTGYFPHDVEVRLGVYRDASPLTTARVALSPGRNPSAGYLLTAIGDWEQGRVRLELTRAGETLARMQRPLPAKTDRFCLSLRREGGLFVATVNDQDGLAFEDPDPITAPDLGFQMLGGGVVRPDEIRVASRDLRNHTFDDAPTDWFIASGTWELTSRWPCTPGWAWFSGTSKEDALIRTKTRFTGDHEVQFYAGAKALPTGEAMKDIIVGLCGGEDPRKGYRFTIESRSGGTFLTKDGQVVAKADGFILSQAAIHFDWTSFAARKQGSKLSLKWWGRTILEYDDPAPLASGYVWLGTRNNGISIPRVTIYGRQE